MAWNPYTDQRNRAFSSILTTLFPEQTKTLPRILVWSIIFLLDLTLGVVGALYYGLLQPGNYNNMNGMYWSTALLVAGIFVVFWLQGAIWYGIAKLIRKRKELG